MQCLQDLKNQDYNQNYYHSIPAVRTIIEIIDRKSTSLSPKPFVSYILQSKKATNTAATITRLNIHYKK